METTGRSMSFTLSLAGQMVHPVQPDKCFCVVAFFTARRRLAVFMLRARFLSSSRLRVGNGFSRRFTLSEVNRTQGFLMAAYFLTARDIFLGPHTMMGLIILVLSTSYFPSRVASGENAYSITFKAEVTDKIPLVTWCWIRLVISMARRVKVV